jgi:hypothetical protein
MLVTGMGIGRPANAFAADNRITAVIARIFLIINPPENIRFKGTSKDYVCIKLMSIP